MSRDFGFGCAFGALAMFGLIYTIAVVASSLTSNFISDDVARAGWGTSNGKIYRVIPAEVTEVGQ